MKLVFRNILQNGSENNLMVPMRPNFDVHYFFFADACNVEVTYMKIAQVTIKWSHTISDMLVDIINAER